MLLFSPSPFKLCNSPSLHKRQNPSASPTVPGPLTYPPSPNTGGSTLPHRPLRRCKRGTQRRDTPTTHSSAVVGSSAIQRVNGKSSRFSSLKCSSRNDISGGPCEITRDPFKLSYVQRDSEAVTESPMVQNGSVPFMSEKNDDIDRSLVKLIEKQSSASNNQTPSCAENEITEQPPRETLEAPMQARRNKGSKILKLVWCYFLGLNATIKIPLLIFIPCYLGVNLAYGAEVTKELTPLWVFGPFILSLYVKVLQMIVALYVSTFKQAIKIVKNIPPACKYVAQGKLKEDTEAAIQKLVLAVKNIDYKELSRRKLKEVQEFVLDKYLDFVESIWPYYCTMIRFLKRANLL